VAEPLVSESRRCKQLQAFYLSEVRALTEGEEVEEFGHVVSPVMPEVPVSKLDRQGLRQPIAPSTHLTL